MLAPLLIVSFLGLPACSAIGARQDLDAFSTHLGRNTDAWIVAWLPDYRTIVPGHEEEPRKRTTPKVYGAQR